MRTKIKKRIELHKLANHKHVIFKNYYTQEI